MRFVLKPYSDKLQLAAITQHLVLKAVQKILRLGLSPQFCLELYLFSQVGVFFVRSDMTSATHEAR